MQVDNKVILILYVNDQKQSKSFYQTVLGYAPALDVPGMTEFYLNDGTVLGLMPEAGIERILGENVPSPRLGKGIPRCELYLYVDQPDCYYDKLLAAGGKGISRESLRNWGEYVAYGADLDGHILAFARKAEME